jgi:ABC-type uncharacterized transport system substrate-binding protein
MNRREFISLLGGAAATWPLAARAQQGERVRRIGVLTALPESDALLSARIRPLVQGLQALGWEQGRNLRIEVRSGGTDSDLRSAARELTRLGTEIIVVPGNPALAALREINRSVPTVFVQVGDPVGSGYVQSLARPGGNMTGFTAMEPEMGGKWVELLKEAAPSVLRLAALLQPDIPANLAYFAAIEAAAPKLNVRVQAAAVQSAADVERAVSSFAREPNGGLIVGPNPVTTANRELIAKLAITHRLPSIFAFRYYVTSGGLLCYGPDTPDLFRRAASYVDRILRGADPADLAVQQPTKFELIINLKTARALGLEIPPTLLARADEVIE